MSASRSVAMCVVSSSRLKLLHEGGILWCGQSLTQHVHDGHAIELQQSVGVEPEPWKDQRPEDPIRVRRPFLIGSIL
jgi:hypothetical protein